MTVSSTGCATKAGTSPCNIEYEYRGGDTVEDVRRCFDFCRAAISV